MDGSGDRTLHYRKLERMYASAPFNHFIRPRLTVSLGHAEVEIPVREELFHAAHAVHGSIYFKALDDAAFFAVASLCEDVFVLTVSFNLHLERPISEGVLKATGNLVFEAKRVFVAESRLTDGEGRELARGSGNFMRSRIPLGPEVGYL
jgi:uncharacterized protein (TIGR00369 family)